MNTSDKQQIIPMTAFVNAAQAFFKCKPDDFDIRMITENQEAFVRHKDQAYRICTYEKLQNDVETMLTHCDHAQSLNLAIWVNVTKNSVTIGRILPRLVRKLEDIQQARMLRLALAINARSEDQYETFWRSLQSIDRTGTMLANAIISAREIYNGDGLLEDITEGMILNGINEYNRVEGGIFETIELRNSGDQYPLFYIYSVEGPITE